MFHRIYNPVTLLKSELYPFCRQFAHTVNEQLYLFRILDFPPHRVKPAAHPSVSMVLNSLIDGARGKLLDNLAVFADGFYNKRFQVLFHYWL